jgi:hypothetical protein
MSHKVLMILIASALLACQSVRLVDPEPSADSRVQQLQEQYAADISKQAKEGRYYWSLFRQQKDAVAGVTPNQKSTKDDEGGAKDFVDGQPLLARQLFKMGFRHFYLVSNTHLASYRVEPKELKYESYRPLSEEERARLGFK